MVYVIKTLGTTVDMVKTLREAESSFKECSRQAEMYAVAPDGSAKLIRVKG